MRRNVISVCVLMLAVSMIPGLTGCRESAAFEQTVYNQDFEDDVVDDDTLNDNQPENEDVEEDLFSVDEREDAEKERNFDESEPIHDSESTGDGQAANAEYLANARDNGTSTQSSGATSGTTINGSSTTTQNSDDSERTGTSTGTSGTGSGEGTGNGGGSGGDDESGIGGDAPLPGTSNGTTSEPPEDPEVSEEISVPDEEYVGEHEITPGTRIATGNAAILVQMLGGKGALLGCDADTLNAMREYFPEDELADVAEVWNSDGSINNDVLNRMDVWPEYCLVEEKDSSAYKEAVEANTVGLTIADDDYIALDFRYATGITEAVETVCETIGTDYADSMAVAYMNFYNEIVDTVISKIGVYNNHIWWHSYNVKPGHSGSVANYDGENLLASTDGINTLFIFDWDESASWTLSDSSSYEFTGSAVAEASFTSSPVSYFMSIAGVENTSAQLATTLDSGTYRYIGTTNWVSNKISFNPGKYVKYIYEPYVGNKRGPDKNYYVAEGLGGTFGKDNNTIGQHGESFGKFPAVIAKNQYVKEKIEESRDSNEGMWSVYPNDGNRQAGDFGGAGTFYSIISDKYDVYVNPSGLGDWAAGSAESVLESAWIASTFYPGKAYDDDDVRDLITEFYGTFYRCDNVNVESILAGKEN